MKITLAVAGRLANNGAVLKDSSVSSKGKLQNCRSTLSSQIPKEGGFYSQFVLPSLEAPFVVWHSSRPRLSDTLGFQNPPLGCKSKDLEQNVTKNLM